MRNSIVVTIGGILTLLLLSPFAAAVGLGKAGPVGGTGGVKFETSIGRIVAFQVWAGTRVDGISLWFSDGSHKHLGREGGTKFKRQVLPADVDIVGIVGRAGDRIDQIEFIFSNGARRGPYGKYGGKPFEFYVPPNCAIGGLFGRHGDEIDRLGILYLCQ